MTIATQPQSSQLARDISGRIVESISIQNWRAQRQTIAENAWTLLGDGKPRSAIYLKNNGSSNVILAPANTGYSNAPEDATAGLTLIAGGSMEPAFGAKLKIYARVAAGGSACQLEVVESF
jgi:hypothetical protein